MEGKSTRGQQQHDFCMLLYVFDLQILSVPSYTPTYLLSPLSHPQIADIHNCLLHMGLFVCFNVNVSFYTLWSNHRLDL